MKYLLYFGGRNDSIPACIRYETEKKEFMIGGFKKFEFSYLEILNTYFQVDIEKTEVVRSQVKRNKIKLTIVGVGKLVVLLAIKELRKQGFVLEVVNSFGTLMR